MGLCKKVATLGLALSLSLFSSNKVFSQLPASINPGNVELEASEIRGIPRPGNSPNLSLDVRVQKGILPSLKIGEVEIRDSSLYASLLFGYYQAFFEQVDDTTFVELLFAKNLFGGSERYEFFRTNKRKDSEGNIYFVLSEYNVVRGEPREEKVLLESKTFNSDFVPAMPLLNDFFEDRLSSVVNLLALGETYTFNVYESREPVTGFWRRNLDKFKVVKYAKMSEVIETPNDVFLMEEYLNLVMLEESVSVDGVDTLMLFPEAFEGKFRVVNSGLWNGNYAVRGVVKK